MQILLYDDKEMNIHDVLSFEPVPTYVGKDEVPTNAIKAEIHTGEAKAELDPTTMKRIAKYNLDKDFDELNEKIKSAEERLEILNKKAEEKGEKLMLMEGLFTKIWNDPCFDLENYLTNEDDCEEGARE